MILFVTFLQVPLAELGRAFGRLRFLGALLAVNFVAVPLLVAVLVQFVPNDPIIRLGVLLVLLCPCIDYVVTFAHLGRADAKLLLASTPALLIVQILLPIYLRLFLGSAASDLVQAGPFLHTFLWLIAIPTYGSSAAGKRRRLSTTNLRHLGSLKWPTAFAGTTNVWLGLSSMMTKLPCLREIEVRRSNRLATRRRRPQVPCR